MSVYELLTALNRERFVLTLLVSVAGGRYFQTLPKDIQIIVLDGGRYPVRKFARAVDRLRPDLVFTTLRMNVTAALARHFQRHRPVLIARQANALTADFAILRKKSVLKHRIAEWIILQLLKFPDVLVAQSQCMAQELEQHSAPGQRIITIGNPVSVKAIKSQVISESSGYQAQAWGAPSLVSVGRLAHQKGYDLLLPAFAEFQWTYPEAGLTIWGEGAERSSLEALARTLGIEASVRFPGLTQDVLAEVAKADLFISCSRYEGFSNAILEAMALGTPVVATNCTGASTVLVRDGKTGILAKDASADALHSAMCRAMEMDCGALAKAAQAHVRANFDTGIIAKKYEDLFHSCTRPTPQYAH